LMNTCGENRTAHPPQKIILTQLMYLEDERENSRIKVWEHLCL